MDKGGQPFKNTNISILGQHVSNHNLQTVEVSKLRNPSRNPGKPATYETETLDMAWGRGQGAQTIEVQH
jgi:hypothetical protein